MATLEALPTEMQLMIFGFAYSGRQIHIREDNSRADSYDALYIQQEMARADQALDTKQRELLLLKVTSELESAKRQPVTALALDNQLLDTLISKSTHTAAWQAHLTSATWSFATVATAERHIEERPFTIPYIKNIRVMAGESQVKHLVRVLSEAGARLHRIELLNCQTSDLGKASPGKVGAIINAAMMRTEREVLQHFSCMSEQFIARSFSDCPILQTLAVIPTLEDVVISTECGLHDYYGGVCDWALHVREAELFVLQAVAKSGTTSPARSQNIARLQATIATTKKEIEARQQSGSIGFDCGDDFEDELESDEMLAHMFEADGDTRLADEALLAMVSAAGVKELEWNGTPRTFVSDVPACRHEERLPRRATL